jgi:hypothetical protein
LLTIESSLFSQEAHFAVGIAADKAHYDGFFFAPLESVDTAKLNPWESLFQGSEKA